MGKRITDLTELTTPATGDFVELVDISDTTQNAAGSSLKVQVGNLARATAFPFGNTLGVTNDYRGLPGRDPAGIAGNLAALSQYDIYTFPIFVTSPITVTGYDLFVQSGQTALTVFRAAIYASSGTADIWQVGALASDMGTVATTSTGAKAVTGLSVPLTVGWHVVAFGANAAALVLYGFQMVLRGASRLDLAQGSNGLAGSIRWWYDYTSSPDYPNAGFPTSLSGNSQQGLSVAGDSAKFPISLRWTNP